MNLRWMSSIVCRSDSIYSLLYRSTYGWGFNLFCCYLLIWYSRIYGIFLFVFVNDLCLCWILIIVVFWCENWELLIKYKQTCYYVIQVSITISCWFDWLMQTQFIQYLNRSKHCVDQRCWSTVKQWNRPGWMGKNTIQMKWRNDVEKSPIKYHTANESSRNKIVYYLFVCRPTIYWCIWIACHRIHTYSDHTDWTKSQQKTNQKCIK